MRTFIIPVILLFSVCLILGMTVHSGNAPHQRLSEYGFFSGPLHAQNPAGGTIPYRLNTPLFSDNAEKLRFLRVPAGASAPYNDSMVFDFPEGTVLIKTFYYPADFRSPEKGRRLLETRLLIHEPNGWKAYPYVWDEEQKDAYLEVAGDVREVSYVDKNGKKQQHAYHVPNMNQCKGCHNRYEKLSPIGPSARQLSGSVERIPGAPSQLHQWAKLGILRNMPDTAELIPALVWSDPSSGTLDQRARIWLDINCAHCHQTGGPAATSGLYLNFTENDPRRLGIRKTPVAAGRGSGNLNFDILPSEPAKSILLHRMASTDPGIMMPELGRSRPDKEAVELISAWIREMPVEGSK